MSLVTDNQIPPVFTGNLQVADDDIEATPNLRVGPGHLLLWHYRQVVGIAKIWKRTEVRLDLAGRSGEISRRYTARYNPASRW